MITSDVSISKVGSAYKCKICNTWTSAMNLHMLHIKLHISAYFHRIFIAYLTNTVYIIAYFLHISCILLAIPAYF